MASCRISVLCWSVVMHLRPKARIAVDPNLAVYVIIRALPSALDRQLAQANRKCLRRTQRPPEVYGEASIRRAAELENHVAVDER